jgi:hypothetical protein
MRVFTLNQRTHQPNPSQSYFTQVSTCQYMCPVSVTTTGGMVVLLVYLYLYLYLYPYPYFWDLSIISDTEW